ncbi:hypothetical protein CsSME_00024559 [Camellia sinensis var. sinensis]
MMKIYLIFISNFLFVFAFLKEFSFHCLLSLLEFQVSDIFTDSSFKVFTDTLASRGIIKVLCVPLGSKSYSNTALKKGDIFNEAIKSGAKGLPFLKVLDDGAIEGIPALVSSLDPTKTEQLLTQCSAGSGDLILFALGHHVSANKTLDRLRVYVAHELRLIDQSRHSILWLTDFPMFEWNSLEQRLEVCLMFMHFYF